MTTAGVLRAEPARIDIGRIVAMTLSALGQTWMTLFAVGFLFVCIPQALTGFLPKGVPIVLSNLANLPALIFDGAATLIAFRQMTGGARLTVGDAISGGARRFGSLWGIGIISGLGTILGLILLIVPGLILLAGWLVATPAVMVENRKATDALDRAWTLSRGSRWRLGAILAIMVGVFLGGLLVVMVIAVAVTLATTEQISIAVADFAIAPLFTLVILAVASVGATAAFVELRAVKEGAGGDIPQVFD